MRASMVAAALALLLPEAAAAVRSPWPASPSATSWAEWCCTTAGARERAPTLSSWSRKFATTAPRSWSFAACAAGSGMRRMPASSSDSSCARSSPTATNRPGTSSSWSCASSWSAPAPMRTASPSVRRLTSSDLLRPIGSAVYGCRMSRTTRSSSPMGWWQPGERVTVTAAITDYTPQDEFFLLQRRESPIAGAAPRMPPG